MRKGRHLISRIFTLRKVYYKMKIRHKKPAKKSKLRFFFLILAKLFLRL